MNTKLLVFLCPSDHMILASEHGNSYHGNLGVGPHSSTTAETPDSGNGFYSFPDITSARSFGDGLSHTMAYSERLGGSFEAKGGREYSERDFGDLSSFPDPVSRDADYALSWCRIASRMNFPSFTQGGETWFLAGREYTSYTHSQEPNGRIPDALDRRYNTSKGVSTARSWHRGGVNALMGDGSIRFVSEAIARPIWRALGTRNGGEIVE